MAITGGFGTTMDLQRGTSRQWVMGRDGVKRWADSNEPVEEWVRVHCTSAACRGKRNGGHGFEVTVKRGEEAHAVCNECLCR